MSILIKLSVAMHGTVILSLKAVEYMAITIVKLACRLIKVHEGCIFMVKSIKLQ